MLSQQNTKRFPAVFETVALRVPNRSVGQFTASCVHRKHRNCPSSVVSVLLFLIMFCWVSCVDVC